MADSSRLSRTFAQLRGVWLPLGVVLIGYAAAYWVNRPLRQDIWEGSPNLLGFPLHITEPVVGDAWLFGQLPTLWLQERLYDSSSPHWHDAVAAIIYVSHFLVIPAVAVILWYRNRERFRSWIWCVCLLVAVGVTTYIVYPMAPPWLAGQLGVIEHVHRISEIGWSYLQLASVSTLLDDGQQASNPVAAMPSMHAASAALVAVFFWSGVAWWIRMVLVSYPLAMSVTLVYTGEHYVVDVLAGCAAAALVVTGRRYVQKRKGSLQQARRERHARLSGNPKPVG